jgi:hypothetical protein
MAQRTGIARWALAAALAAMPLAAGGAEAQDRQADWKRTVAADPEFAQHLTDELQAAHKYIRSLRNM